jgi:hypothetical protein
MQIADQQTEGFTIKTLHGCRLVYGAVPLSEFGMLTHGFSKKALMAIDIADRIGASFVIGEPDALAELRRQDLPVSAKRQNDAAAARSMGLDAVADWLLLGERGASSNAMCKRIFGVPDHAGIAHPADPADLRRCVAFLDATGGHDRVGMMADVSPAWSQLVEIWPSLVETLRAEAAEGKAAPKTQALMQGALAAKSERHSE